MENFPTEITQIAENTESAAVKNNVDVINDEETNLSDLYAVEMDSLNSETIEEVFIFADKPVKLTSAERKAKALRLKYDTNKQIILNSIKNSENTPINAIVDYLEAKAKKEGKPMPFCSTTKAAILKNIRWVNIKNATLGKVRGTKSRIEIAKKILDLMSEFYESKSSNSENTM